MHLLQSQLKINNSEKSNELILKIENIIDKRKIQNGSLERSLLIEKINYELLRENYNQLDTQLLFLINKYSDENLYDLKSKRHLRQISELYKDLAKIFVYQNKYHEARWANQISILKLLELNYDSTSQVIGGRFQQRGQIMYYLNQFDSALLFYNLCLNGLKSISGEKSIDYQEAKIEVATFYWNINKIEEAEQLMSEGCTKLKEFMVNNMSGFSEKQRQEYVNILSENMSKYYSLNHIYYNSNKGMATTAYNFILQSKGLNFNSTNYFNKLISSSGDTILNKRIQELKNMRKQLVIYYAKNIRHSSIDSLEDILTTSEQALTFDSPSFANFQKQNNATFDDVKKNLVPGEAAIEFISFPYYNKDIRTDSILLGAYVVTATSEQASYISLCNNSTLVNLLKAQGIAGRGTIKPNSKKLNETFKILYSKVWDPLENYLPGIKKIFIASDGLLNRLAFISLQDKNDKLIFDKYEVHFVLSTKDIAKVKASQKKFVKSSISLFGGANYSLVNKGALKDSLIGYRSLPLGMGGTSEWDFLPSTLTEVKNISKELKVNKWIVNSYIGNEASENNFKYQNGKNAPSLIHIATHGFYFPLIRRSNSINTLNSKFVYKESENPMLRSGLLFSSANEAWMGKTVKDDSEDGILTAFELANIDLSKTELIVLSACETGLGDVLNGEGVFGLQRAIKLAGVNKMIVSLWSVPDRETAEMMEEFYSALLKEKSIFKAFHFAQTVMRNRYPNKPVLWAGFILIE